MLYFIIRIDHDATFIPFLDSFWKFVAGFSDGIKSYKLARYDYRQPFFGIRMQCIIEDLVFQSNA